MSPATAQTIELSSEDGGQRLDRWLRRRYPGLTQGRIQKWLREGQIRLDGKRVEAGARIAAGQVLRLPPMIEDRTEGALPPKSHKAPAAKDRLALQEAVLYQDADLIVLNKPPSLAVQGGSKVSRHIDAWLDVLQGEAKDRPRLVHRLDKDTSGVLLLARTPKSAHHLTRLFATNAVEKLYWSLVVGLPNVPRGTIDLPLRKGVSGGEERMMVAEQGKPAISHYRMIDHAGKDVAWLALLPETGRTHQLRVHCAAIGCPILGDGKYGGAKAFLPGRSLPRQLHLHARAIRFRKTDGKWLEIRAPLPPHMRESWQFFGFNAEDKNAMLFLNDMRE